MDDRIIIHQSKEYLKNLLAEIEEIAGTLGIFINHKKTQIVKISHGFTWLKTRYYLTESGKIIKKIPKDTIVRERRKLKSLSRKIGYGEIQERTIAEQYRSWRGGKNEYQAYHTLQNMDLLYRRLENGRKSRKPEDSNRNAKNRLSSNDSDIGDYKITKIYEARLCGESDPYDASAGKRTSKSEGSN